MAVLNDGKVHEKRVLSPTVLTTKEQLLVALRTGSIKTSKYNLLDEEEKLFVELVAFGDYTPETAVRTIYEDIGSYAPAFARRLMSKKEIIDTLDELTDVKDKSFRANLARTRELALKKLEFIMMNSRDEKIQVEASKIILATSNDMTKMTKEEKDGRPAGIKINIAVDNMNINPDDIIIPLSEDAIDAEYESIGKPAPKREGKKKSSIAVDPNTGMPYTLSYEGINSYELADDYEDEEEM